MTVRGDVRANGNVPGPERHNTAAAAPAPDRSIRVLVEKVLPIAKERALLAVQMKEALERGDERSALSLLRKYLDLPILEMT